MSHHAVIFDCDGVLVDSETISATILVDMAKELDLSFDNAFALEFIRGRKVAEWMDELGAAAGQRLSGEFTKEFRRRCASAFDDDLVSIEGIEDVLHGLDMAYCCASSAPHEKIIQTLGCTGLLPLFEGRIYSAYEVGAWKPDPTLFIHAANDLGIQSNRCAVIEDSIPGVQAGVRAGMKVFGSDRSTSKLMCPASATFRTERNSWKVRWTKLTFPSVGVRITPLRSRM